MTPVFADTSYFLAFLGEKDQHHERAVAWSRVLRAPIVTTEYVILEVGNSLTKGDDRSVFVGFYRALREGANLRVIPALTQLQDQGVALFAKRLDKRWSLTDCISFVVMGEEGIGDALTADSDFQEAGFRALLRHDPDIG